MTAAHAATTNPPTVWYKTSGSPTDAEITAAAARYRVVILNAWETAALHKLKALNPSVTVLVYKCLSSTRSYAGAVVNGKDATFLPAGVGYVEAAAHPEWFALDTNGNRVQWGPYPGHWQMAVWDPAYQQRWAANVAGEVAAQGWDGVLADNALTSVKSYFSGTLGGGVTSTVLRAGERSLIAAAAGALHAKGKILVPNISEARLFPGLWADWTGIADGGMEENYVHWGTDPNNAGDYCWDWGSSGWAAMQAEMASPGLMLAVTRSVDSDQRSYRLGLASFLIGGGGRGGYEAVDDYVKAPYRTEQSWSLGVATEPVVKVGAAYTRVFPGGFAAANPSKDFTVTVPVPAGMLDVAGNAVSSVTLGPLSGAIFHGTSSATTATKKWRHYSVVGGTPVAAAPSVVPATTSPRATTTTAAVRPVASAGARASVRAGRTAGRASAAMAAVVAGHRVAAPRAVARMAPAARTVVPVAATADALPAGLMPFVVNLLLATLAVLTGRTLLSH